jgi:hypothetical protein
MCPRKGTRSPRMDTYYARIAAHRPGWFQIRGKKLQINLFTPQKFIQCLKISDKVYDGN